MILIKFISVFLICLSLIACPRASKADLEPSPQNDTISFRSDGSLDIMDGNRLVASFDIEIAETGKDRVQGLMYRESMDANQGMLFIFDASELQAFWMKDTYLALDMIFIDSNLRITQIEKNSIPFSEDFIISNEPVRFVLEVLAGTSERLNIQTGQHIRYKRNSK